MSDAERAEILDRGGRRPRARDRAHGRRPRRDAVGGDFGATEDYLVTREFKAISTMEERQRLIRCCFLVMSADDEIDATRVLARQPDGRGAGRGAPGPQRDPRRVLRPDLRASARRARSPRLTAAARPDAAMPVARDRTPAGQPSWSSITPSPDAAADLGDQLRVVGDAPQLHRERVAAGRRHVDDHARRPGPLAQHAT